ncbi:MAG: SBBP repeat-containing protein [Deltaproteobacteria bacterium]|nr:SBBP repeat-containing protein [Deltaproteobacteria bacterium]
MKTKLGLNLLPAIVLFLFSVSFLWFSGAAASGKADRESILEAYGNLPLHFIENKGQLDSRVRFYVKTSGQTLYFTDEGIVFDLLRWEKAAWKRTRGPKKGPYTSEEKPERLVFSLGFENAREGVLMEGLDRQEGGINFLAGNDRSQWKTGIPTYRGVVYKGVYKGIDLKVFGNGKDIEYEFVVNPGGEPEDILLTYNGIEGLAKNGEGELLIATAFGQLKETKPYIYQEIEGETAVDGRFEILSPAGQSQTGKFSYGFQVAAYDPSYPLIIDPVLSYSTYLGGSSGDDIGMGIAADASGNAYVAGYTYSSNFPTSTPYQGTFAGTSDAFITKLSSSGSALSYSTYLGGSSWDVGCGIAIDASNNAYVTGYTLSTNFPTRNPYQGTLGGDFDAFVAKLSPSGNLSYATYLGGGGKDYGYGVAVTALGSAFVTGDTASVDFPTASAYQPTFGGSSDDPFFGSGDAFIARLSSDGNTLFFSTYLGGSSSDAAYAIAIDNTGNSYVTGYTASMDFPTLTPVQGTLGGSADAFIAKLSYTGSALFYATYLGGSSSDSGYGIAVDAPGNVYVAGETYSTNFPTVTPLQLSLGGGSDAFITKLSATGNALSYSTYLGGAGAESGNGIAVDASGRAYVTGYTASLNFPTFAPIQAALGGSSDAFVTKLTSAGNAFYYSTYLGGNSSDYGNGIAVDASDNTYVTGYTYSDNFPTANAYQPTFAGGAGDPFLGNSDAFVTKVSAVVFPPCPECDGDPVVLTNVRFRTGTQCECVATTSITMGPNVIIENGAQINFKAPRINIKPGVDISPGAIVNMNQ